MGRSLKQQLNSTVPAVLVTAAAAADMKLGAPVATGVVAIGSSFFPSLLERRTEKALEFIDFIAKYPGVFTEELTKTTQFEDGAAISMEAYLKERDADKRVLLRSVFMDFASSMKLEEYPLERLNEITRQITLSDARVLRQIVGQARLNTQKPIQPSIVLIDEVSHLLSLGLLYLDMAPRTIAEGPGLQSPYVFVTGTGFYYAKFIEEPDFAESLARFDSPST